MSGWLGKIFSSGAGTLVESVGSTIDKFHTSKEEKALLKIELEKVLQQRDSEVEQTIRSELGAKERIIVAELNQGDRYTKRARPTFIYVGLGAIVFNYCLVPLIMLFMKLAGVELEILAFDLPVGFWSAWGGIVGSYAIGRSMEKRGNGGKVTELMTGRNPNNNKTILDL